MELNKREVEILKDVLWGAVFDKKGSDEEVEEMNRLWYKLRDNGLEIRKEKDCFGGDSYFGYKDGKQYTEDFYTVQELKRAYEEFKNVKAI